MRCSRAPEGTESRTHTVRIAAELGEEPSGRRDQYPRHSELEARVGRVRVWAPGVSESVSVTAVYLWDSRIGTCETVRGKTKSAQVILYITFLSDPCRQEQPPWRASRQQRPTPRQAALPEGP